MFIIMKKILALLMVVPMTLGAVTLSACGGNNQPETPAATAAAATTAAATEGAAPASKYGAADFVNTAATPDSARPAITGEITASDGLEVTALPLIREGFDSNPDLLILFTNNTGKACDIALKVDFLDADGKVLQTTEETDIEALLNGSSVSLCWGMDDLTANFAGYRIKADAVDVNTDWYAPIDDQLKFDYQKNENNVTFTVTNTGTQVAHWVNTHVLFIKGGKVVDYTFETCDGQKITEIQPGETVTTTVKPFIDGGFDDVMVFVHGTAYAH